LAGLIYGILAQSSAEPAVLARIASRHLARRCLSSDSCSHLTFGGTQIMCCLQIQSHRPSCRHRKQFSIGLERS